MGTLKDSGNGLVWTHEVYDVYTYPEGYEAVMAGRGEWYPAAIQQVGPVGKCSILQYGIYKMTFDPQHPRCYSCGKFVKSGDGWRGRLTAPCRDCGDTIRPW